MSNPLDEYISKKCDEILLNDKDYCEENNRIIEMEKAFKATLTSEQKKAYGAIECACISQLARGMELIGKAFLEDKAL